MRYANLDYRMTYPMSRHLVHALPLIPIMHSNECVTCLGARRLWKTHIQSEEVRRVPRSCPSGGTNQAVLQNGRSLMQGREDGQAYGPADPLGRLRRFTE